MSEDMGDPLSGSRATRFAPEAPDGSSPEVTPAIADWLTDDLIEPLAAAICFGGFNAPDPQRSPLRYWRGVSDSAKADYRSAAKTLLMAACRGDRLAPREPDSDQLAAYMKAMRLANRSNAAKHFREVVKTFPTMWQLRLAQGIEAGTGETAQQARSSDESPVGNADAPNPSSGVTQEGK